MYPMNGKAVATMVGTRSHSDPKVRNEKSKPHSHAKRRKRKRSYASETSLDEFQVSKSLSKTPLHGMLLAVTTRTTGSKADDDIGEHTTTAEISFTQLRDLCLTAGANVSSQVHKKVHAVIASPEAVATPATQRVRKAWKLGIPVLQITWLQHCIQNQQLLSMDAHSFPQQSPHVNGPTLSSNSLQQDPECSRKKKLKLQPDKGHESSAAVTKEVHIDLGCCCICHDSVAEGVVTDCAWCVDCSVNQQYRAAKA